MPTLGKRPKYIRCKSMDFFETVFVDRAYPMIYCHLQVRGDFNLALLKKAVRLSSQYVPEIFYKFDFKQALFVDQGFSEENVLVFDPVHLQWDVGKNTQLKICVQHKGPCCNIIFAMSHILSDGAGMIQYLYLLSALYNNDDVSGALQNNRDIAPLLTNISIGKPTQQMKKYRNLTMHPLRAIGPVTGRYCLKCEIPPNDFEKIHSKAKRIRVTLNDVFLAAYATTIAKHQQINTVAIPCPADLRRFHTASDSLLIANLTGTFENLVMDVSPQQPFEALAMQINTEMAQQKSRNLCFSGVKPLNFIFRKIPNTALKKIIRSIYRMPPVSYTNLGAIDGEKLSFKNTSVESCFFTASYRKPPDFQLTISTFQNTCTLNSTLLGNDHDKITGQEILEQVTRVLLDWVNQ